MARLTAHSRSATTSGKAKRSRIFSAAWRASSALFEVFEDDDEFVPARADNRVRYVQAGAHVAGGLHQDLVAGRDAHRLR